MIVIERFGGIEVDSLSNAELTKDILKEKSEEVLGEVKIVFSGYVGNRPSDFYGAYHEDDTWAIDIKTDENQELYSYLYTSNRDYINDVGVITKYSLEMKEISLYRRFIEYFDGLNYWVEPVVNLSTYQMGLCGLKLLSDGTLEVTLRRPGLLIGYHGRTIKEVEKFLDVKIIIKEKRFW